MQEFLHHQFSVQAINDSNGPAIMLEQQEGIEDTAVIVVHPWQLRAACEHLGIIASDKQAERTIARLQRQLLALNQRVEHLADYLANWSGHKDANLNYVQTYATATAEVVAEFRADLDSPASLPADSKDTHPRIFACAREGEV